MKKVIILFYLLISFTYAQSITEDLDDSSESENLDQLGLTAEKIEKISASRRIFILTNNNSSFDKGDFISLVLDKQLATRALVAKINDGKAGLKITKVYDLSLWRKLKKGMEVQIIRGDDSSFSSKNKGDGEESDTPKSLLQEEEDLYNKTTLLEDDLNLEEKSNRKIKTDNLVTLAYGQIRGVDAEGSTISYSQFNGTWMYQVADNTWASFTYGQNIVHDFPSEGLDTKLTNMTIKGSYTFGAPFYSYILPYIGYQIIGASSPGAGEPGVGTTNASLQKELESVDELKKSTIIFGVTLLKRLVPGWFARADLGTDIIGVGFGLEF